MNYNNLFPRLLKNIPKLPSNSFCYDCKNIANDNKNSNKHADNVRCFIPSGKRLVLWFLKHDSNYYSILLEYQNSKILKCHFKYIPFQKTLASGHGTMVWVTQIGRELTLNKMIYLKGKYCNLKTVGEHMDELRFLLDNYIHNISHSSLIQLKLPVISNSNSVLSFVGNLNYLVYNVVSMKNNYNVHVNNFLGVFKLSCIDSMNDCYSLVCKDKNGKLFHYQNALINNAESSIFVKKILKIKHKTFEDIENSDSDSDYNEQHLSEDDKSLNASNKVKSIIMYCIYDRNYQKWKPYKVCRRDSLLDNISKIKTLEEKSSHI